uniref:Uncharacterized protein n=1 Tax=Rhizophora mucronata TaxID=61149 RepID=A0A2P2P6S3_RHIMU
MVEEIIMILCFAKLISYHIYYLLMQIVNMVVIVCTSIYQIRRVLRQQVINKPNYA